MAASWFRFAIWRSSSSISDGIISSISLLVITYPSLSLPECALLRPLVETLVRQLSPHLATLSLALLVFPCLTRNGHARLLPDLLATITPHAFVDAFPKAQGQQPPMR